MDISAIVLNKLLSSQDLESFARVKLSFIDPAYSSVFSAISRHYTKYSIVPSFDDLEIGLRDGPLRATLEAVKLTDSTDVAIDVAIDALIDQYTQNETVRMLDMFVDKLTMYDTTEIKDELAAIVLKLDEKTLSTEGVDTMDSFMFFQQEEEITRNRVMLGINNDFDSQLMGVARSEYILIGGPRGSGKSIVVNNIFVNQYLQGNSPVYFSIEMKGRETLDRTMSILAGVSHQNLKQNKLTPDELLKVVKARAGMFVDSDDLVEKFKVHRDRFKFEETLVRTKELKPDNQLTMIHDRALTVTSIDIHLGKLKAKFGDKLTVCVVDYVNQVKLEGSGSFANQFDWMQQTVVSAQLKNLGDKYDLVMVSPYQIDAAGEARFSKGLLDAADIALVMEVHDKDTGAMGMATTKIRGGSDQTFTSGINWDTLAMSATPMDRPNKKEKPAKEKKPAATDANSDVPWG